MALCRMRHVGRIGAVKKTTALAIALLAAACAKPLPPDKADYAGEWQSPAMYLLITKDGSLRYKRLKQGGTVSVDAPIKEFQGNNIVAGVGPMATTFVVSKPPYKDAGAWKMVVDDEELTRTR